MSALIVRAMSGDTVADLVLGQADFTHGNANFIDGHGFSTPESVAIDKSAAINRLYVADFDNSRVLGYKDVTTFINGGPADLVIGQPDFISSTCNNGGLNPGANTLCNAFAVATDASGNLYVADQGNSRVLEYTSPFAACAGFPCVGGSANLVFGQGGSFTTGTCNSDTFANPTAIDLCTPFGVAVDASGNV